MEAADLERSLDPVRELVALGFEPVRAPERVHGGWDTLLWRFATADGREHVLRVHPLPDCRSMARRERCALDACARAGLPAPRVEAVGETAGHPALVLSWCPGVPLLDVIERRPWTLRRVAREFGRAQAAIHAVTPPAELVAEAPDAWVCRVPPRYRDLAEHVLSLGPSTDSLVHLDYHPLNVVSDGGRITGVLDWTFAGAGDPRADLARTEITLLAAPIPPGPLRPLLDLGRRAVARAWRAGYAQAAGGLPDYRPLRAWAGALLLWEIEPALGRPGVWQTEADLERLRARVETWARQAGIR